MLENTLGCIEVTRPDSPAPTPSRFLLFRLSLCVCVLSWPLSPNSRFSPGTELISASPHPPYDPIPKTSPAHYTSRCSLSLVSLDITDVPSSPGRSTCCSSAPPLREECVPRWSIPWHLHLGGSESLGNLPGIYPRGWRSCLTTCPSAPLCSLTRLPGTHSPGPAMTRGPPASLHQPGSRPSCDLMPHS